MKWINALFVFISLCVFSGCGSNNAFVEFFGTPSEEALDNFREKHPECFLDDKEEPSYWTFKYGGDRFKEQELNFYGYEYIGSARFWGVIEGKPNLIEAAKKVGARAVIYADRYKGTKQGVYSYTTSDTTYSNVSGTIYGVGNYSGQIATTTYKTHLVPYNYDVYDQVAHFFIKCR